MIFAITVAPTACKYFVCLLRECPACVRLGNAKAGFRATLGSVVIPATERESPSCHPRPKGGDPVPIQD